MHNSQIHNIASSGYIFFGKNLNIQSTGGQVQSLFELEKDNKNADFRYIISSFDKENRELLRQCLNRSRKTMQVTYCTLRHHDKNFLLTFTPLAGDGAILSFSLQQEGSLLESDHAYLHALHSKTITLSFNKKLKHVKISGPVSYLTNQDPDFMIGRELDEIDYPSELKNELEKLLERIFKKDKLSGEPIDLYIKEKHLGIKIWAYAELNAEGKVEIVHTCLSDFVESKTEESTLLPVNERYSMALEASDLGLWEWDVENKIIYFSRKWKSQLGYYSDELSDQVSTFEKLLHNVDRDRVLREFEVFFKSDSLYFESEFRLRHKNGHYLWIACRASCVRNRKNTALRLVGVNRDISVEKKNSNELAIFKQAMIQSPVSMIITDMDGYIEFFNHAFHKKSGWSPEEIIGKKPSILKSGFHSNEFYAKLWETITNGNVWQGELKNKRKNGRYFSEFATISPLRNSNGTITHFVKVSEDITLLKKMENDLRTLRRSAEIANIYKNNFLANMSHKIRTPINGIIGFSDLLKYGEPSEEQKIKYINLVQQNSYALLHLIDNIIDVARIEANEMKIKKESCSLRDTFIELQAETQKLLDSKGKKNITLNFISPREDHHDVIFTDPVRLKQILIILFENALKQTEKGFIELGYQVYSERKLQFYVHDTGVGISDEQLEILTQQIGVNKKNIGQTKGGMGLGLSICRGLVTLLGGQIGVKSKKGNGTIFYFTIPYDKIKVQTRKSIIEQSKTSKFDFSKYTILVAEDVTFNFEYLQNIFASTGANILWAKDGIDVLNIFNNQKVDLILMDIQLPEISGFDATRQIRQKNKTIPIIAQTGYTMDEDREKCLSIGCNDVLVKPLKIEDVLRTVSKYLKG